MYRIGDFIDMGYYKKEEFSLFLKKTVSVTRSVTFQRFKRFFYVIELFSRTGVFYRGFAFFVINRPDGIAQFAFDIGNPAGCGGIAVLVFDIGHNLFVCRHRFTLSTMKNKKRVTVISALPVKCSLYHSYLISVYK